MHNLMAGGMFRVRDVEPLPLLALTLVVFDGARAGSVAVIPIRRRQRGPNADQGVW